MMRKGSEYFFLSNRKASFYLVLLKVLDCEDNILPLQPNFKSILTTLFVYAKTHPTIPRNGTTDDRSLWSESPTGH